MSEARHEPREEAKTDGAGSSANFAGWGIQWARKMLQSFNYTASGVQPP
jgi:hypothetical protein